MFKLRDRAGQIQIRTWTNHHLPNSVLDALVMLPGRLTLFTVCIHWCLRMSMIRPQYNTICAASITGSSSSSGAAGGGCNHCARCVDRFAGSGQGGTWSFSSPTTSEAMNDDPVREARSNNSSSWSMALDRLGDKHGDAGGTRRSRCAKLHSGREVLGVRVRTYVGASPHRSYQ